MMRVADKEGSFSLPVVCVSQTSTAKLKRMLKTFLYNVSESRTHLYLFHKNALKTIGIFQDGLPIANAHEGDCYAYTAFS